jgi:diguanylate cyclase (GGDEF)-like protein/PAS domain S-box-containing protein
VTEPAPLRGMQGHAEPPPFGYAGRTRYTQLEYDALLANLSIGIAFTRERRFFLCNARFARMLGYAPDELIGQSGEAICTSAQSYAALGDIAGPQIAQGRQLDVEWELRRRDGSTFAARMIARAIDPANPQQGTVWTIEDITDKRRDADDMARLSREREAILATASIGIAFIKDRRIVRCNRRYEEMYGYGPGELDGKSTALLYTDISEHAKAAAVYETLARGETSRRVELRRRKDGATFWSRADGRAVDPREPHQGSVWIVEDVTERRRAEEDLRRLVREQNAVLENAFIAIAFSQEGKVTRCNRRFQELLGYGVGHKVEVGGEPVHETLGRGEHHNVMREHARPDGSRIWCRFSVQPLQPGEPAQGSVWLVEDVTQEHEAEERVQRALGEQELILDNASVGIAFVRNRIIQRCNRFLEEMVGEGPGELVGQSSAVLFASRAHWEQAGRLAYQGTAPGETHDSEWRFKRRDGSSFLCRTRGRRIDAGEPVQEWIWSFEDVTAEHEARELLESSRDALERAVAERTAELEEANARARHLADHDPLTGLPNRRLLEDRLTQALALSYRNRKQTAVMFVDLDRFKAINDSLGHAVGDLLLKEVAQRLVRQLRVGDTICRIGGDEFVVVLPEIKRSEDAAHVAQKVLEQLSQPVIVEERELIVTPSIGIAVFPEDGRDAETLIRNSDAAMYHAKELGRANYQFFTAEMNQAASRRLALEADLRRALGRDELRVHYQPIVRARSGRIAAHEALVRWQHPERGLIAPADFIDLAEETGLILKLGEWVLRQACRWATFIGVERGLPVSVNLSPRQFNDPKLVHTVAAALHETGLPARLLQLEITESTAMQHTDVALATLRRLKELGVSVAIDDFGTGYSSLSYLKRFPVDTLKIDGSFTSELPGDPDQCAIVSAIVALAHALELEVIAEGVETAAQREFLESCGCDYIQGYLTGMPLDADSAATDFV